MRPSGPRRSSLRPAATALQQRPGSPTTPAQRGATAAVSLPRLPQLPQLRPPAPAPAPTGQPAAPHSPRQQQQAPPAPATGAPLAQAEADCVPAAGGAPPSLRGWWAALPSNYKVLISCFASFITANMVRGGAAAALLTCSSANQQHVLSLSQGDPQPSSAPTRLLLAAARENTAFQHTLLTPLLTGQDQYVDCHHPNG